MATTTTNTPGRVSTAKAATILAIIAVSFLSMLLLADAVLAPFGQTDHSWFPAVLGTALAYLGVSVLDRLPMN